MERTGAVTEEPDTRAGPDSVAPDDVSTRRAELVPLTDSLKVSRALGSELTTEPSAGELAITRAWAHAGLADNAESAVVGGGGGQHAGRHHPPSRH